jgi:hypothetical protein
MVDAALAENLPHRSREHEFTDGRVYGVKDRDVLYGFGRVERVGAGAVSAPLPRNQYGMPFYIKEASHTRSLICSCRLPADTVFLWHRVLQAIFSSFYSFL